MRGLFNYAITIGGAAASVTASRLAEATNLKILILEAGPLTKDKLEHIQPGQYPVHLLPTTTTATLNVALPSPYLGGRSVTVPSGRCVGGGSSINFTVYTRPSASDYDDWEVEFNNPGWGSKQIIPLLKDLEKFEVDPNAPSHGSSGPLRVSYGTSGFNDAARQFLDIAPKYEKRRPLGSDANAFTKDSINVFSFPPDGLGITVVVPIQRHGIASGVEFIYSQDVHPGVEQSLHSVRASKLVVVSAGTFGSPMILERSGIGNPGILKLAGIAPIVDNPDVGTNYQDHLYINLPCLADPELETFDALWRGDEGEYTAQAVRGVDAAIKLRPFDDELKDFGEDFLRHWKSYYANKPDKPLMTLGLIAGFASNMPIPPMKFITMCYFSSYPASRGSVHIKSDDPYAPPQFNAGFLNQPFDIVPLRWGYKKTREYARRMPFFRGAYAPTSPEFDPSSSAALTETLPVDLDAPDIVYTKADDDAIDKFIRKFVETTWHSAGTCAMKPREVGGVVDPRLNVYGIKNLKVADLSIIPSNVHSNTCSTALAIGAKAAIIIAEDLKLDMSRASSAKL
ncbi:hypothetical protein ONZ45_g9584 [Pleurotus djamor]|nr:hypothetical protein ONZ45_g9584 [Pleurotus djamor]